MAAELEFSGFFKLLNAIKEGESGKKDSLASILIDYKQGEKSESFLHQLGQKYLYEGISELYNYTNSNDLQFIGNLTKEDWDELAKENNCDLPIYLANKMINAARDDKMLDRLSTKWKTSEREIEKHIMPMARYITEGIIDVLE